MDETKYAIEDYIAAIDQLFCSMSEHGFNYYHPIPIDRNGELLDGSHRVACALALGIEKVPVIQHDSKVWAPPWDSVWFFEHGCPMETVKELGEELEEMKAPLSQTGSVKVVDFV